MAWSDIDQNDYAAGFQVGYRAIKGTAAGLPGLPGQPGTKGNMTAFLMGVRKGLERAGIDLDRLRIMAIFAAFAMLSGCAGSVIGDKIAGPEKLAQQDDAYCQSIGLKFGTPEYAGCRLQTTQRREDRHFQATQSAGDDLIAAGAAISANSR